MGVCLVDDSRREIFFVALVVRRLSSASVLVYLFITNSEVFGKTFQKNQKLQSSHFSWNIYLSKQSHDLLKKVTASIKTRQYGIKKKLMKYARCEHDWKWTLEIKSRRFMREQVHRASELAELSSIDSILPGRL